MLQILCTFLIIVWFIGGVVYSIRLSEDIINKQCLFTVGNLLFGIIFIPYTILILIIVGGLDLTFKFVCSKRFEKISKLMSKRLF